MGEFDPVRVRLSKRAEMLLPRFAEFHQSNHVGAFEIHKVDQGIVIRVRGQDIGHEHPKMRRGTWDWRDRCAEIISQQGRRLEDRQDRQSSGKPAIPGKNPTSERGSDRRCQRRDLEMREQIGPPVDLSEQPGSRMDQGRQHRQERRRSVPSRESTFCLRGSLGDGHGAPLSVSFPDVPRGIRSGARRQEQSILSYSTVNRLNFGGL